MNSHSKYKYIHIIIIPIIVAIFNVIMILFPKEIIISAKNGLLLWYNSALPSLLPFIICTNLLTGLGFPCFIGTILEPFTSRIFKTKGCGVFPIIMGIISGYPIGAKLTVDLYNNKELTKQEAQKLLCYTNNSGPLFILGAVAIGMFNSSGLGYFMMLIHYLSSITIGIVIGISNKNAQYNNKSTFTSSLRAIKLHRLKQNKSFGEIFGDSTRNGIESILLIGGYIMIFSVIMEILTQTGIMSYLTSCLTHIGLEPTISKALVVGTLEITNGCKVLSQNTNMSSVLLSAGLISWGGFSIHAQTISFISKTDLKTTPYLFSKLCQGVLTYIYGLILFPILHMEQSIPTSALSDTILEISNNSSLDAYTLIFTLVMIILALITLALPAFNTHK